MMKIFYLTFLVWSITLVLNAQDMATTEISIMEKSGVAVATEESEEEAKSFSISGFVDGYYMYNFNETGFSTSFTDVHNQFSLGMANVVFAKEGKVGFVADIAFGPRAEAANGQFFIDDTMLPTLSAIKQLYITYSPTDVVSLSYGTFSTFIGYELIDSPGNVNYSTSYLFSNGPFYHTGLKADVALGKSAGVMVGIFNDTDNKFDIVPGKHFGAQFWTEIGGLAAYLNVLTGKEEELGAADQLGFQVDLTATYEVSEKLIFGLNVSDKSSTVDGLNVGGFTGAAVYSTIGASNNFSLGLRAEYFSFKNGDDFIENDNVFAITTSGNITLGNNLILIPELRFDFSNNATFFPHLSDTSMGLSDGMSALIVAVVYSF